MKLGGSGGIVKWNPSEANVWVLGKNGKVVQQNNPIANLGYELGQAYDANNGLMDDRMEQGLIGMNGKHPTEKILLGDDLVSQLEQIIDRVKMLIQEYKLSPRIISATNVSVKPAWLPK